MLAANFPPTDALSPMRVLVTGHSGYIGSVLVPLLQSRGHVVRGMDTDLFEGCDLGAPPEPIPASATDIRDVRAEDLENVEAVVHLAGMCNDPLGALNPSVTEAINASATGQLVRAARAAGVRRFVFSSTCSVYGFADAAGAVDESSPPRPLTEYARSKLAAEREVLDATSSAFTPVVLRSGSLFGASPRLRTDLVVNGLTAAAWATGNLSLDTDGSPWRPLVDIRDVCATMAHMLEAPRDRVAGQIYNVGTDEMNVQVADIARIVAEQLPGTVIRLADGAGPDERSYRATFRKLAGAFPELGFRADLAGAVRDLVAEFVRAPLDTFDLESGRYVRLAVINRRVAARELDANLRAVQATRPVPA
jgi:nucleoside-diphosphate-sugar epimerase